ncbi:hypothetical protein BZG36_03710 [Bifiguratus adelaidae]|uniref:ATP-binding domain 1 family member B homolog n=1 Tax=Bifiguratus adelaidae TaxID=1938954 RepID=A0A261XXE8_9FUNG|nr:hypothetical protein BZG36_03710 [Bifiguratus adelaidae]
MPSTTIDADARLLDDLLTRLHPLLIDYYATSQRDETPVVPPMCPEQLGERLQLELPEEGSGTEGALNVVQQVLKYSVQSLNPRFMDKLYAGSNPIGIVSELLIALLNTNSHVYHVSPVFTLMEMEVTKAVGQLLGMGKTSGGILCPGGSSSNQLAMITARNKMFPSIKTQGYLPRPYNPQAEYGKLKIFTSSHGHYSIDKTALALGLGTDNVIKVAVDDHGRMDALALDRAIADCLERDETPFFINATAGTTVLGTFDPIRAISAVAKKYGCWLHVDGSWGGSAIFSSSRQKTQLDGSELADTFTLNPHKLLGVPLQCSLLITPHDGHLLFSASNSLNAGYLFHGNPYDLGDGTVGCGRRPDALKLYLGWIFYGRQGYERRIEHAYAMAAYLTSLVRSKAKDGFKLVMDPSPFMQICFWYTPPSQRERLCALDPTCDGTSIKDTIAPGTNAAYNDVLTRITQSIHRQINESGEYLVDYAPLSGHPSFFRVVVNAPTVQERHLDRLMAMIERIGQETDWDAVVIGPPGSGKTTYCYGMYQFMNAIGRKCSIVNLDPANENLPYPCAVNIFDLITLEDAMESLQLGPNGAMIYCMEFLKKNMDWLVDKLKALGDEYILFDFPGQVELFTHHSSVKELIDELQKLNYRLVAVHLVDAHYCLDPSKYISVLLISLKTMIQLELPHVNILSKVDLMESYGKLAFNLEYYTEVMDLDYLQQQLDEDPINKRYKQLNKALCELIEDFSLVGFYTLAVEDKKSMMNVLQVIDKAGGYIFGGLTEELLGWLNELLQINYTKVEQVGTGAAYCQILDSIYGDVPMKKVKFEARHDYEYVGNYKILQTAFDRHRVDKIIPVERLMKCKFQDNLEFLQWFRRYWDQYYPGGDYDAVARRHGSGISAGGPKAPTGAPRSMAGAPVRKSDAGLWPNLFYIRALITAAGRAQSRSGMTSGRLSSASGNVHMDPHKNNMIVELNEQLAQARVTLDGLEKERDFYFGKLRDIEILVQQQLDKEETEDPHTQILKDIQNILYSTEASCVLYSIAGDALTITVSGPKIVELAPTEDNDKDKVDEGEAADADDASTFAAAENAQYWVALMKVDWSIACLNFEGVFAELSLAYTTPNLKFIKMDLDINPQLESQLSISTGATSLDLPTVILFEREKGELARLPPPATQDRSTDRPTMTDVTHNARETLQRLGWDRSPRSVIQAFALEKRYAETISSKKKR